MVKSSKDGILLQFRWSRIALSFDGLTFLNVKGDIPICSLDLTFKYLFVPIIGRISPSARMFIYHSRHEVKKNPIFESENIGKFPLTFENNLKLTTI